MGRKQRRNREGGGERAGNRELTSFFCRVSFGCFFRGRDVTEFLQEELPIRLAHRVKELDELPENLNQMPSIIKVKEWYAQSFEVSTSSSRVLYEMRAGRGWIDMLAGLGGSLREGEGRKEGEMKPSSKLASV